MKTFKQFLEDTGISAPTNVTAGVSVGPNDIGVSPTKQKKYTKPVLTNTPLTRNLPKV